MGGWLFLPALDCTIPQLSHAPASPPKPRRKGTGPAAGIAATELFPTDPIPTSPHRPTPRPAPKSPSAPRSPAHTPAHRPPRSRHRRPAAHRPTPRPTAQVALGTADQPPTGPGDPPPPTPAGRRHLVSDPTTLLPRRNSANVASPQGLCRPDRIGCR
jgi:hypothetical protein